MKRMISLGLVIMMLCTMMSVSVSAKSVDIYEPVLTEKYDLQTPMSYFTINNFRDGSGAYDVLGNDATNGVVRKIWFKNKYIGLNEKKVYAAWNGFSEKMTGSVNKISFDYKLEGPTGMMIGFGTTDPWFCYSQSPWFIYIRQDSLYIAPNAGTDEAYDLMNSSMDLHKTYVVDNTQWNRMTIEIDKAGQTGKVYVGETLVKTMDKVGTAVFLDTFDAFAFECPMWIQTEADSPILCMDNLKIEASDDGVTYTTTLEESYSMIPGTDLADYDYYQFSSALPLYSHNDGSKMTEGYIQNDGGNYARQLSFNQKTENQEVYAGLGGFKALATENNISKMSLKFDMKVGGTTPITMFMTRGAAYCSQGHLTGIFGADKAFAYWMAPYKGSGDFMAYPGLSYSDASSAGFATKLPYVKEFVPGSWYTVEFVLDFSNAKTDLYMNGEKLANQHSLSNPTEIENLMFNIAGAVSAGAAAVTLDNIVVSKITTVENQAELADASGSTITAVTAGDTVYLNATVANDGVESMDYMVIAAAYNEDGKMLGSKCCTINDVAVNDLGSLEGTEASFIVPTGATTLKAFLMTTSMTSVCDDWVL